MTHRPSRSTLAIFASIALIALHPTPAAWAQEDQAAVLKEVEAATARARELFKAKDYAAATAAFAQIEERAATSTLPSALRSRQIMDAAYWRACAHSGAGNETERTSRVTARQRMTDTGDPPQYRDARRSAPPELEGSPMSGSALPPVNDAESTGYGVQSSLEGCLALQLPTR